MLSSSSVSSVSSVVHPLSKGSSPTAPTEKTLAAARNRSCGLPFVRYTRHRTAMHTEPVLPAARLGALLDAVRGVRWPARRPVRAALPGTHASRMRGVSPEFTEYRPYRQGDDPRRLDWRLLARSDRAYIRLADDRAVLPTLLVVDASASMAFPAGTLGKWRCAAELAVALAAVAHASGDPVGLTVPRDGAPRPLRLEPRSRRGVVSEIAQGLGALRPAGAPALAAALAEPGAGARVVVISDFLGDEEPLWRAARERIAAGGEVHALHVVAAEELSPPSRAVLAVDPERAEVRRPLTAESRDAYLAAFAGWRDDLARRWRAAGASYTLARTDEPVEQVVRRVAAPPMAEAR